MDKHISDCRNNNSISKLPIYVYNCNNFYETYIMKNNRHRHKGFKTRMDKHISDCRNNNSISKLPIYVYNYHI